MVASKVAERLRWAVETLAVGPSDHLLEIGANHFSIREVLFENLRQAPAFCVVAEPA